jgi:hypothetical protein
MLLVLGVAAAGCQAPTPLESSPQWVRELVAALERQPVANPPAFLAQYIYRGDTTYYLPSRCCDIQSQVFDRFGTVICAADGGITGEGDGRCPDYFTERREERIIWRDSRGRS